MGNNPFVDFPVEWSLLAFWYTQPLQHFPSHLGTWFHKGYQNSFVNTSPRLYIVCPGREWTVWQKPASLLQWMSKDSWIWWGGRGSEVEDLPKTAESWPPRSDLGLAAPAKIRSGCDCDAVKMSSESHVKMQGWGSSFSKETKFLFWGTFSSKVPCQKELSSSNEELFPNPVKMSVCWKLQVEFVFLRVTIDPSTKRLPNGTLEIVLRLSKRMPIMCRFYRTFGPRLITIKHSEKHYKTFWERFCTKSHFLTTISGQPMANRLSIFSYWD